eukprot:2478677-Amphidinium_carterae.3
MLLPLPLIHCARTFCKRNGVYHYCSERHCFDGHWNRDVELPALPADDVNTPPCVKLHGLLPAPRLPAIRTFEPALENRAGVITVWTDGSGRHSSDPHHRRCGVGYYTDTQERAVCPLPAIGIPC